MNEIQWQQADSSRLVSPLARGDDGPELRPRRLQEYVGQTRVKEQIALFVEAARHRQEALDHVLLMGPPGLGKTTMAHIIAGELGVQIHVTSGPALERAGDLAAILTALGDRDVLFIDEIHRLGRTVEEVLYPAMEDGALDIVIGKGPGARSIRLDLPPFTLVGATTRAGLLTSPLRDRFGVLCRLEFYDPEELRLVLRRASGVLQVPLTDDGAHEIAERGRGTPRVALRLLKRLRDFAQVRAGGVIDRQVAREGLGLLEVDEDGLDRGDRQLLHMMAEHYGGGPVGVETLAAALAEEADTIQDVYEPYLMQCGLIARTPRGRVLTAKGRARVGLPPEPGLFG